jgi:hypothetical protein
MPGTALFHGPAGPLGNANLRAPRCTLNVVIVCLQLQHQNRSAVRYSGPPPSIVALTAGRERHTLPDKRV